MADYQVGGLSQLIGQSSDVKELDDLFKATSKPEIVESSVIDIQQWDSIAAKNDVDLENDNTDEGVEKSQKFNQLSRNFQINNEEKNKTKVRDKEQEERTIFIGNFYFLLIILFLNHVLNIFFQETYLQMSRRRLWMEFLPKLERLRPFVLEELPDLIWRPQRNKQ